jgi:glutaminase
MLRVVRSGEKAREFVIGDLGQGTLAQYQQWLAEVKPLLDCGHLPAYVPELAQVNPVTLGLAVRLGQGDPIALGDRTRSFSLMSVMKPFLLLYALEQAGFDAVFDRVGMLPSDQSFHSLKQLAADRGKPRNPMINSGAIALVDRLPGRNGNERCAAFRQWLTAQTGIDLVVDQSMLASVRSLPNDANRAIAQMLKNSGAIGSRAKALDTYNQICCLSVTVETLAQLGLLLALPQPGLQRRSQQIVNAMMLTCGVYEASGEWAVRMGLPIKSGVSGGILAIVPQQGAIAIYAPAIDAAGNSVAGACLLEKIIQNLDLGLF